ncbi:MAG: hypothetical protein E6H94_11545, partial [Chloroflexi bacterium]
APRPVRGRRARNGVPSRARPASLGRHARHRDPARRRRPRERRDRPSACAPPRARRVRHVAGRDTRRAPPRARRAHRSHRRGAASCGGLARARSSRCWWRVRSSRA